MASFKVLLSFLRSEGKTWFGLFGLLLMPFTAFLGIANFLNEWFSLEAFPYFDASFRTFSHFAHIVAEWLIYSPLTFLVHGLTAALSKLGILLPEVTISVPRWFTNLAIVSAILLRTQRAAMRVVEPQHINAHVERGKLSKAAWAVVLIFWKPLSYATYPLERAGFPQLGRMLRYFLGSFLLLGFWYFIHDSLLWFERRRLVGDADTGHRSFMLLFVGSLAMGGVVFYVFLVLNGLLI